MPPQTRKVSIIFSGIKKNFDVKTVADWKAVSAELIKIIKPGMIITLSGHLGAGKTTLVQFLSEAMKSKKVAQSPTFALMRIYPVNFNKIKRLVHVDAYRIEDEKDLLALDLNEELLEPGTVIAIEWPENIKKWLVAKKSIEVKIDY